ncbi:MAG TPA: polyprenol monophosphomannose synthase, partial [Vicinamibacterales bacterium]|nr:polyprenol monophosphomannose synthase [Vicinamibacterales bacterium]
YDEADNIERMSQALLGVFDRAGIDGHVLFIDDASPDGTGQLADALAAASGGRLSVLHRTGKRGLGRSYLDGMKAALATDADVVFQMDADLSHDPKYLPDLIAAVRHVDISIGSRYLQGVSVVNWPLRRLILSTFANWYVRTVTGMKVRDCTAGFRCWRRDAIARMPLDRITSEGYSFQVETLFLAIEAGCTVSEVPIVFVERRVGASKISGGVIRESFWTPWRLVLRRAFRPRSGGAAGYNSSRS